MDTQRFLADYERAMDELEGLGKTFENKMKLLDKDFSAEYFCWMFETLLQYSFIELAQADDDVSLDEIVLSKKIIRYANVVSLGNSFLDSNYKWSDFVNADPCFVRQWLDKVRKYLGPLQSAFVSQFAMFDAHAEGDSFAEVSNGLKSVLNAFVNADSRNSAEEITAVSQCMIMVVMREIAELMSGR